MSATPFKISVRVATEQRKAPARRVCPPLPKTPTKRHATIRIRRTSRCSRLFLSFQGKGAEEGCPGAARRVGYYVIVIGRSRTSNQAPATFQSDGEEHQPPRWSPYLTHHLAPVRVVH